MRWCLRTENSLCSTLSQSKFLCSMASFSTLVAIVLFTYIKYENIFILLLKKDFSCNYFLLISKYERWGFDIFTITSPLHSPHPPTHALTISHFLSISPIHCDCLLFVLVKWLHRIALWWSCISDAVYFVWNSVLYFIRMS